MRRLLLATTPLLALLLPGATALAAPHETGRFVLTAPKGATYTLVVPDSYDRRKGATLLLWLHGAGDNHANAARALTSRRFRPDWILAVPDARANGAWQMDEEDRVMDVLDEVEKSYTIRRAFIGGFSRGGFFTFGFGLAHTDRFVGYLCVSGGLPNPALVRKGDAGKFHVAIVHGEADTVVPFDMGTKARDAFRDAGWGDRLFFRSVPGLAHRIDQEATAAAIDWLDENAFSLRTPKDHFDYAMKLYARDEPGRAYWALSQIDEATSGEERWWKQAASTKEKIEKACEKEGKKLARAIGKDRNAKWLPDWREFDAKYEGVPYHETVRAAFDERAAAHGRAADALFAEAEAADAAGDPKAAATACLSIRDECYAASGGSVEKAKALLARYRADKAVAKKLRRLLKGTEDWK